MLAAGRVGKGSELAYIAIDLHASATPSAEVGAAHVAKDRWALRRGPEDDGLRLGRLRDGVLRAILDPRCGRLLHGDGRHCRRLRRRVHGGRQRLHIVLAYIPRGHFHGNRPVVHIVVVTLHAPAAAAAGADDGLIGGHGASFAVHLEPKAAASPAFHTSEGALAAHVEADPLDVPGSVDDRIEAEVPTGTSDAIHVHSGRVQEGEDVRRDILQESTTSVQAYLTLRKSGSGHSTKDQPHGFRKKGLATKLPNRSSPLTRRLERLSSCLIRPAGSSETYLGEGVQLAHDEIVHDGLQVLVAGRIHDALGDLLI
eukprot:scaffold300_cov258-Pinguiococcus_pyrenoidosus.AAC.66